MSWYLRTIALAASATATRNCLHLVDLTAAAGDVTITLPSATLDPTYVGVTNASIVHSGAKVIKVLTPAAVQIAQISAAGGSAWFSRDAAGAWVLAADSNPSEYEWIWTNAAARQASDVFSAQVGRVGYQSDIARGYRLLSVSPLRWGELAWEDVGTIRRTLPIPGDTTVSQLGYICALTVGTAATVSPSGVTKSLELARTRVNTAAAAGSYALFRSTTSLAMASITGYRWRTRCVLEAVVADYRWFMGSPSSVIGGNIDPATLLNVIGMGRGNGEANVQLYHNDGAGVCTQIDLGANFAAATAAQGYDLEVYTLDGSSFGYQATVIDTGFQVSGTLSSNIPVTTPVSLWSLYCSNNATASACGISHADFAVAQIL